MSGTFDVHWVADTLAEPPPAPDVLVDGMLRRGELCILGAPRGTGKSWLALNVAGLVGGGNGYLFGTLQVRQQTPVLVCHGETPAWMAAHRWQILLGELDPPQVAETFEHFRLGALKVRHQFRSPDGSQAWSEESCEGRLDERLRRTVLEHGIGLVVIDPWATFYTGSENSNDETEAAVSMLRQLAADSGAGILIVHHLGKSQEGRDPEDLWRGASRLADAAATRVTLLPRYSAKEASSLGLAEGEARRHVRVRLLRREAPTPGFTAYLGHDGWWSMTPDDSTPAGEPPSVGISIDELTVALAADGGSWSSLAGAARSLGISTRAASVVLARATDAGLVVEVSSGSGARGFALRGPSESDEQ